MDGAINPIFARPYFLDSGSASGVASSPWALELVSCPAATGSSTPFARAMLGTLTIDDSKNNEESARAPRARRSRDWIEDRMA